MFTEGRVDPHKWYSHWAELCCGDCMGVDDQFVLAQCVSGRDSSCWAMAGMHGEDISSLHLPQQKRHLRPHVFREDSA